MPKTMRRKYKKRSSKGKKALTKPQKSAVTKIVKKLTNKKIQTKFRVYESGSLQPKVNALTSFNIFYYMVQGTGQNNFVGEKVNWQGLRFQLIYNRPVDFAGEHILHVAVLGSRVYKTLTSLTSGEVLDPTAPNDLRFPRFDKVDGRILLHKAYKIPNAGGWFKNDVTPGVPNNGLDTFQKSFYLPMKGKEVKYNNWGASYDLEKENYYVCYWVTANTATGNSIGTIQFVMTNYYKDA